MLETMSLSSALGLQMKMSFWQTLVQSNLWPFAVCLPPSLSHLISCHLSMLSYE